MSTAELLKELAPYAVSIIDGVKEIVVAFGQGYSFILALTLVAIGAVYFFWTKRQEHAPCRKTAEIQQQSIKQLSEQVVQLSLELNRVRQENRQLMGISMLLNSPDAQSASTARAALQEFTRPAPSTGVGQSSSQNLTPNPATGVQRTA